MRALPGFTPPQIKKEAKADAVKTIKTESDVGKRYAGKRRKEASGAVCLKKESLLAH